jgi:hypothetical protein
MKHLRLESFTLPLYGKERETIYGKEAKRAKQASIAARSVAVAGFYAPCAMHPARGTLHPDIKSRPVLPIYS